jgi:uncharacterized protein YecE (DUF72 family)
MAVGSIAHRSAAFTEALCYHYLMQLYVGTSGYNYDAWKGSFYPDKLPKAKMLSFYATQLKTVEINYTFYRMPSEKTVRAWIPETPPGFRFALKASQRITHQKRLKETEELVTYFFTTAAVLGDRLGPILFQLPPNLKADLPRLEAFLDGLPAGTKVAFEFRHESWWTDAVYGALSKKGAALCVADAAELATPMQRTAPYGYFRLRREDYDERSLAVWADRVASAGFTDDVFVFFKHEDRALGVSYARAFAKRMAEAAS